MIHFIRTTAKKVLPNSLKHTIKRAITPALPKSAIQYYSPNPPGQDRWIMERVFPGMTRPGFFIEAGASDGIRVSNTYALEKYRGWTGIACEPHTLFFEQLKRNRQCMVDNVCLANTDGEVDFIEAGFYSTIRESGIRLFGEDVLQHQRYEKDIDGTKPKIVKKTALSLASLLKKWNAPSIIHYLSLDLEGNEYEVLKDFPFDQYTFLAMTVEDKREPLRQLLKSHNYVLVQTAFSDDFWLHPIIYATYAPD